MKNFLLVCMSLMLSFQLAAQPPCPYDNSDPSDPDNIAVNGTVPASDVDETYCCMSPGEFKTFCGLMNGEEYTFTTCGTTVAGATTGAFVPEMTLYPQGGGSAVAFSTDTDNSCGSAEMTFTWTGADGACVDLIMNSNDPLAGSCSDLFPAGTGTRSEVGISCNSCPPPPTGPPCDYDASDSSDPDNIPVDGGVPASDADQTYCCMSAGEYKTFCGLQNGMEYTITTCGATVTGATTGAYVPEMTLYPQGGGTPVAFSTDTDNSCGSAEMTFTWTGADGACVDLIMHSNDPVAGHCSDISNGLRATIGLSCNNCPPPPSGPPCPYDNPTLEESLAFNGFNTSNRYSFVGPGDYLEFCNLEVGQTYIFTFCPDEIGSADPGTFDPEITVYPQGGGTPIAFNEDAESPACSSPNGTAASVTFTYAGEGGGCVEVLIDHNGNAAEGGPCNNSGPATFLNGSLGYQCTSCPEPDPDGSNNDCSNATIICVDEPIIWTSTGPGTDDFANPLNQSGCLIDGETQTAWYYFEFADDTPAGSLLTFDLAPDGGTGEDYDFAVWGPNVSCDNLGAPIRCSAAAPNCTSCPNTGVSSGASDPIEQPGCGGTALDPNTTGPCDGFVSAIQVEPGAGYWLMIDNWLGSTNGFFLDFGGTAAAHLDCDAQVPCGVTTDAGGDLTACAGTSVTLDGSNSVSGGGANVSWSGNVNGSTAFLDNPNSLNPTATIPADFAGGDITYVLTINEAGCENTDEMILSVTAAANAGVNNSAVSCSGGSSFDLFPLLGADAQTGGTWSPALDGGDSGTFDPSVRNEGVYTYTVAGTGSCPDATADVVVMFDNPSVTNAADTAPTCGEDNGEITVTATGGTGTLMYSVGSGFQASGDFTGLAAGTYTVTVQDENGCEDTETVTLTDAGSPTVDDLTPTAANCGNDDGEVNITISGGTGPYNVTINGTTQSVNGTGTFTGLAAMSYAVTIVDANSCEITDNVTVDDTPGVTVGTSSADDATCGEDNGSVSVSGTGGSGTLMYSLDGGTPQASGDFAGLAEGSYTVEVSDANGCTDDVTLTVGSSAAPTITSAAASDASCGQDDGSITVTATGGTGNLEYFIDGVSQGTNNVITGLSAGNYDIEVIDENNCSVTGTASVADADGPSIDDVAATNTACDTDNGTIEISVSGGDGNYEVFLDGVSQGSSLTLTGLGTGNYAIEVTDGNDCTAASSAVIATDAGPTISDVSESDASCGNDDGSITVSATGGTGNLEYFVDGVSQGTNNVIDNLGGGNYDIEVIDENGCSATSTASIADSDGPEITSAVASDASCGQDDGSITVTATGGSGNLEYFIDGVSQGTNNVITGLSAGNYDIEVIDENNCSVTGTASVADADGPSIDDVAATNTACDTDNGTIEISVSGGDGNYEVFLDGVSQGSSLTLTGLGTGNYAIEVTDGNDCTAAGSAVIATDAGPTISDVSESDASCGNDDGSITITATGGTGNLEYFVDGVSQGSNNVIDNLGGGNYDIEVIDENGCSATSTASIADSDGPEITSAVASDASCGNDDGSITITATGGTGNLEYFVDGVSQGTNNVIDNLGGGNYDIEVIDENGCSATSTASIADSDGPEITSATASDASCGQDDGSITISATGGFGNYEYFVDGVSQGTNNVITGLASGNYDIEVIDENNCSATSTASIADADGPSIDNVAATNTACDTDSGTIEITVSGGDGNYEVFLDGVSQGNSLTLTGLGTGNYDIEVTDGNDCTAASSAVIATDAGPVISSVAEEDASCGDDNGTFTINATGGTGALEYFVNGVSQGTNNVITGLGEGNYDIEVIDASGCSAVETASIANADGPVIEFVTPTNAGCDGEGGSIELTVSGGDGNYEVFLDGVSQGNSLTLANVAAGDYDIEVIDGNDCSAEAQTSVSQDDGPEIVEITPANASCGQDDGTLTVEVNGGSGSYEYFVDGVSQGTDNVLTGLGAGSYMISVQDAGGCEAMQTASISNNDGPEISAATANATPCGADDGTVEFTVSGGDGNYEVFLNGVSQGNVNMITGLSAGEYTIEVVDGNDCSANEVLTVEEEDGPTVSDVAVVNTTCGDDNGGLNVSAAGGVGDYDYSLDGVTFQDAGLFTDLPAGEYTVYVQDDNGCEAQSTATIVTSEAPAISEVAVQQASCGADDGTVTVTATGDNLEYSLDGVTFQTSNVFNGLAADSYTVYVQDVNECEVTEENVSITEAGAPTVSNVELTEASCGQDDGTITVTGAGGSGSYMYQLNDEDPQASNVFNVPAGDYTISVIDENDCAGSETATVVEANAPEITAIAVEPALCGEDSGTVTITAEGGTGTILYSVNGGAEWVTSNVFSGLSGGLYDIMVQDENTCSDAETANVEAFGSPVITDVSATQASCGNADATITVTAEGGSGTLLYSLDGENYTADNVFAGQGVSNYEIFVIDANDCTAQSEVEVTAANAPMITQVDVTPSSCDTPDGTLTVTAEGGTGVLMYSVNGTDFFADNVFTGLAVGEYNQIFVQDEAQCQDAETAEILQANAPMITDVTFTDATCDEDNGTVQVTATGGTGDLTYIIDGTVQDNGMFTDLPAGTDIQILVQDTGGCEATEVVSIAQNGSPEIISVTAQDATCGTPDGALTVNASGSGLEYSLDGVIYVAAAEFTGLDADNYTVYVQNADGCVVTSTTLIAEIGAPEITEIAFTEASCGQADGTLTVTAEGDDLEYSLDGVTFQTDNVFAVAAGDYTVYVQNAGGCEALMTANVPEANAPMITAVTTTDATCGDNNGTLTIEVSGGTGDLQYSINGVDYFTTNVFENVAPAAYSIFVQDENDCEATDEAVITNLSAPVITGVDVVNTACGEENGTITVETSGGTGDLSFSIDGGITFSASNVFTGLPANGYDIVVIDDNCEVTEVAAVSNDGAPDFTEVAVTDTDCDDDTGTITVSAEGGAGTLMYSLDGINYQASNVFENLPAGSFVVYAQDENNCLETQATEIIASGEIEIAVLGITEYCEGTNGTTLTADGTYEDYLWSTGATTPSITVNQPGTVTLTASNGECVGDTEVEVEENPTPEVSVTGDDEICEGDNTTLSAGEFADYEWSNNATTSEITVTQGGEYTVEVTDENGCIGTGSFTVVANPLPQAAAGADQTITCLEPTVSISANNSSDLSYEWTLDGEVVAETAEFETGNAGTYTLTVIDVNTECENTDEVVIDASDEAISAVTTETTDESCFGNNDGAVNITEVTGGNGPYTFALNDAPLTANQQFNNLTPGEYDLTVETADGCVFTEIFVIEQGNDLVLDLGEDFEVKLGEEINLEGITNISSGSLTEIMWSDTAALDCPDCLEVNTMPLETTSYILTVSDGGCTVTDEVTVYVNKLVSVFVPSAFSPDNDGINDRLNMFTDRSVAQINYFSVYDRWGEQVWTSTVMQGNDEGEGWEGDFRGKTMDTGVYLWHAEVVLITGEVMQFKGDVTLFR